MVVLVEYVIFFARDASCLLTEEDASQGLLFIEKPLSIFFESNTHTVRLNHKQSQSLFAERNNQTSPAAEGAGLRHAIPHPGFLTPRHAPNPLASQTTRHLGRCSLLFLIESKHGHLVT
jgi:hypothetical protein